MPRVSPNSRGARIRNGPKTLARQNEGASIEQKIGNRITPRADGCWIFDGNPDKYGTVFVGTAVQAHRYVYETLIGRIRPGLHIHHECQNKGCVNPDHLAMMTPSAHMKIHAELRRSA